MNRMIGTMVLVLGMTALAVQAADLKEEMKQLNGTWRPKSGEMAGKTMSVEALKAIKLIIADDKYTVTVGDGGPDRGTVKVDPTKKPKTIDIVGSEGPNKGKTILAIYEVSGDTLKICYDLGGKDRPTDFKTATGTMLFMLTYQREKVP